MSNRYKGGVISATPPTTTGGDTGTASGAWTLEQQMQAQAAGLWPSQPPPNFIENVFSTYLYTGNGSTQAITNGINLSGRGGMVWFKNRSNAFPGNIFDTVRNNGYLTTTSTGAVNAAGGGVPPSSGIASFNNNGFTIADGSAYWNSNSQTYASWTFREQAKFFDIVTWTGNGSYPRTINHNLGSTPGCIIIKSVSDAGYGWITWHRSLGANDALQLQTSDAATTDANFWNGTPTSTTFSVGSYSGCNANGVTYVAYLWAHNAGGFGLTGTDNVISCGSFTTDANGFASVNLGYEPQWLMVKSSSSGISGWEIYDQTRGWSAQGGFRRKLTANIDAAETSADQTTYSVIPTATGFTFDVNLAGYTNTTFIYITIRRGPMAVPTLGTNVFSPNVATTQILTNTVLPAAGFPVDLMFFRKSDLAYSTYWSSRLLPQSNLQANDTAAEITGYPWSFASMTGVTKVTNDWFTGSATPFVFWQFRRAPSFFDQVCYTGTGTAGQTFSHNLGVVPELMIVKKRDASGNWPVYSTATGNTNVIYLNFDTYASASNEWNNTTPTASVFTLGTNSSVNNTGNTYVAYLFATCPGVSKVGSYTGTGAAQTINCGFTTGSRFVLIKRYDNLSVGDWYLWDSARGIIPSNDPYVVLNTTAAPVTGTDYIDTTSVGFDITSTAPAGINANGGTYIFLAIA
jgi:hypothetical protein